MEEQNSVKKTRKSTAKNNASNKSATTNKSNTPDAKNKDKIETPLPEPELTFSSNEDKKILEMLLEAIKDEAQWMEYLGKLMYITISPKNKELVRQIRLDDQKHYNMLIEIYNSLVGEKPEVTPIPLEISDSPRTEYEKCMLLKLQSIEFYRKIYFSFLSVKIRDMLFEIITDEQNNAVKFLYLYC